MLNAKNRKNCVKKSPSLIGGAYLLFQGKTHKDYYAANEAFVAVFKYFNKIIDFFNQRPIVLYLRKKSIRSVCTGGGHLHP